MSNNWLTTLNFRSDLPIKLPIKTQLFLDVGTFANAGNLNPSGSKLLFDGGVQFNLLSDLLEVYVPFIMSRDFRDYTKSVYTKNRFLQTISFNLKLSQIDVLNLKYHLGSMIGL
jgi:hypothetical protein